MEMENNEENVTLYDIDNKMSHLLSLTSECNDLFDNDNDNDNEYNPLKRIYFQQECNEIDEAVSELIEKMEKIKNMLLMDKTCPEEINYKECIDLKIEENKKQREFMNVFGPCLLMHQMGGL